MGCCDGSLENYNAKENVDGGEVAHDISEGNKESTGDFAKSHSCYSLVKNLVPCYSYPGNLSEAE